MSFRPVIIPDSGLIHLTVPYDARSTPFVNFDGKSQIELKRGDVLEIEQSKFPLPTLKLQSYQHDGLMD